MKRTRWAASAVAGAAALFLAGCVADAPVEQNNFAGSQACAKCHSTEYKTWQNTLHAKMVLPAKVGLLKDAGDNWAKDAKGNAGPTKGNISGAAFKMDDVVYVLGTKWKQRYLVKNPTTGNHQFMDKQWNRVHQQWEPYGQRNDWETQCATCHATGFRITAYDAAKPQAQKVSMVEHNIGCESCHGPGAAHIKSMDKKDIFNPKNASVEQSSLVCGYCHVRKENYNFKTAQGSVREDQPHPVIGDTYKAGQDDWRRWYPDKMLIPGVLPNQPVSENYPNTDLFNAFFIDDKAKAWNSFDGRKHHQEYQEYLQSKHYTKKLLSCSDCHSPHAVEGKPEIKPAGTCAACHGTFYDVKKIMPGLASTAQNLFVQSHTFNKAQDRKGGPTASGLPEPAYYYKK